jgi:hypothetical protein
MFFAEAHRAQGVPHKIAELVDVEARVTLKRRQLPHHIRDFSRVWTKTESLCFMPQDEQAGNELNGTLILVHAGPGR